MKKLLYLFGAMALMAGMVACGPDEPQGPNGPVVFDGFFVYGDAVGTDKFLPVNQMAAGSNEVNKQVRTGMYEKYIWLEANKDFSLVEYSAGNYIYYGAELKEVNYGYDEKDPNCKNFADNPNMKIQAGQMVFGSVATDVPAMRVAETGMYHIVLDNNFMEDLEYPQIIIQRAKWGVRGGMNGWGFTEGVETVNADGSVTYLFEEQIMGAGAEFKFASCNGWKINLDIDNLVKAEVGLGVTDGKLSNTGGNIAETPKNGIYTITLTWKPSAGSVANAFKHTVKMESELPTKTVLKGLGEKENLFIAIVGGEEWIVRYLTAGTKYTLVKTMGGEEIEFNNYATSNLTVDGTGFTVAENGLYLIYVNHIEGKQAIKISNAEICGLGDAFGGWDSTSAGQVPFTVNPDGTVSAQTTAGGLLRTFVKVESFQAWQSEFSISEGKITYRATGGDFTADTAATVTAGQTITYNFNEGTGSIN